MEKQTDFCVNLLLLWRSTPVITNINCIEIIYFFLLESIFLWRCQWVVYQWSVQLFSIIETKICVKFCGQNNLKGKFVKIVRKKSVKIQRSIQCCRKEQVIWIEWLFARLQKIVKILWFSSKIRNHKSSAETQTPSAYNLIILSVKKAVFFFLPFDDVLSLSEF
jgi:hypothetical protein